MKRGKGKIAPKKPRSVTVRVNRALIADVGDPVLQRQALRVAAAANKILAAIVAADAMNAPYATGGGAGRGKPTSSAPGFQRCRDLARDMERYTADVEDVARNAVNAWKRAKVSLSRPEKVTSIGGYSVGVDDAGKLVARVRGPESEQRTRDRCERKLTEAVEGEAS